MSLDIPADRYQLQLRRDKLVRLCATWQRWLPDLQVDEASLPEWGPSAVQLVMCTVDAHAPGRGQDRHYEDAEDEADEADERDGGEEDFITLDAVETADIYRQNENVDDL